jgi:hypothetical protein
MEHEITRRPPLHHLPITSLMQESWTSRAVWFWACIRSLNAWLFVFEDHTLPEFPHRHGSVSDTKQISMLWKEDAEGIVETKVRKG